MADKNIQSINFRPSKEQETLLLSLPQGKRSAYIRHALDVYTSENVPMQLNRMEEKLDILLELLRNGASHIQVIDPNEMITDASQQSNATFVVIDVQAEENNVDQSREQAIDETMQYFMGSSFIRG
ncbi:hypothetical protein [Paenibacillus sp. Leaf72]|uniref:hypothetical protein n=1 Tax=Paenibacillus sp. Leaf72 TaxID=1736234 RepID=UPI0006FB9F11|nr:hypothetical protein [Paenibacillus sp. Leaf72]KQN97014.1 hypothetical protein ASF12_23380 [Paenibacillus sp. Leaf72]